MPHGICRYHVTQEHTSEGEDFAAVRCGPEPANPTHIQYHIQCNWDVISAQWAYSSPNPHPFDGSPCWMQMNATVASPEQQWLHCKVDFLKATPQENYHLTILDIQHRGKRAPEWVRYWLADIIYKPKSCTFVSFHPTNPLNYAFYGEVPADPTKRKFFHTVD